MSQDGPKKAPRRPGDGLKTARRRRQDGLERPQVGTINHKIGISCRRSANFAKSAMHRPSSEVVSLKWRKIDVGRPEMIPRWPKTAPRCPRWPKMAPRLPQGDPTTGVSCMRGANFAKSAMPSQIHSPRRPKVAQSGPRTAQDGPRRAEMVPRWPKMARRWSQDGAKMGPRRSQDGNKTDPGHLSDVADLHFSDRPKSSKLSSRVSEVRFFAGLW